MKNTLLKFLVSRAGGILTPIIATAVGAAIAKLASYDSSLASQVDQVAVTGFVVSCIMAAVNYLTNTVQTDGIKKIQALVNATQDGIPGPVTYTEVRKAIPAVND
jgi:hydroxylamine reductase (hybrid-cluster protein)